MAWTWVECQACDGESIIFCLSPECEGPCEHDTLCAACHGYGMRPSNDVLDVLGSDVQERTRTRAQAWRMIEEIA